MQSPAQRPPCLRACHSKGGKQPLAVVDRRPHSDPGARPRGHLRSAPSPQGAFARPAGAGDAAGVGLEPGPVSQWPGDRPASLAGGRGGVTGYEARGAGSPQDRPTGGHPPPPPRPPGPRSCRQMAGLSRRVAPAPPPTTSDHVSSDPSSVVGEPVPGHTPRQGAPAAPEGRPPRRGSARRGDEDSWSAGVGVLAGIPPVWHG